MNKIIYKQKNKIALALLVLGGVVSNVGVTSSARLQECVTRGNTPKIRVTSTMTGDTITSFQKTNLSKAIKLIRTALANQGKTGRSIRLLDGIQPITNEEQFARVTGDIQCHIGGKRASSTSTAEEDLGVGPWKPKTSEVYVAELATALNVPDLSRILRFVLEDPDNFMTDGRQTTFRAQFPNLNGFSPRLFEVLSRAPAGVMIAQVDYMPGLTPPTNGDEESRVAEALKPTVIEVLQLMFEAFLENGAWYVGLNESIERRFNNFLAILKRSVHPLTVPGGIRNGNSSAELDAYVVENSSVHLHSGEDVNLPDRCVTLEVRSEDRTRAFTMYFNEVDVEPTSTFVYTR